MRVVLPVLLVFIHSVTGFPKISALFAAAVKTSSSKKDECAEAPCDDTPTEVSSSSWFGGIEFENYDPAAYKDGETSALNPFQLYPLLQIPVSFSFQGTESVTPIRTFCDTGAMHSVMSWEAVQRCGLSEHLNPSKVVDPSRILGQLPAGLMSLHLYGQVTVPAPAILVLRESSSSGNVELILGLDFLREHGAIIDLRDEELRVLVGTKEYNIPFLRPRSLLPGFP